MSNLKAIILYRLVRLWRWKAQIISLTPEWFVFNIILAWIVFILSTGLFTSIYSSLLKAHVYFTCFGIPSLERSSSFIVFLKLSESPWIIFVKFWCIMFASESLVSTILPNRNIILMSDWLNGIYCHKMYLISPSFFLFVFRQGTPSGSQCLLWVLYSESSPCCQE